MSCRRRLKYLYKIRHDIIFRLNFLIRKNIWHENKKIKTLYTEKEVRLTTAISIGAFPLPLYSCYSSCTIYLSIVSLPTYHRPTYISRSNLSTMSSFARSIIVFHFPSTDMMPMVMVYLSTSNQMLLPSYYITHTFVYLSCHQRSAEQ